MFRVLNLPDLDGLDPAALKAMILAQHRQYQDHFQAQHEKYTATLTSRTSEIERLVLLVEKLRRMVFGAKSEKVLRQIDQLELQLEELQAANAVEESKAAAVAEQPAPARPFRRPFLSICHAKYTPICRAMKPAPTAAADSVSLVKTWPRCWSMCEPASRFFAMCVRS